MSTAIPGLHHVTAISGPPQPNVDFYTRTLKQRLVKRTVNFDDPGTYHLYYSDRTGSPGTILTFFPFVDAGLGRAGAGMADAVAYAASPADFDRWMDRLALDAVDFDGPVERFGGRVITLRDPDGLAIEIVESDSAAQSPLDGFFGVSLWLDDPAPTARLLVDHFGLLRLEGRPVLGRQPVQVEIAGPSRHGPTTTSIAQLRHPAIGARVTPPQLAEAPAAPSPGASPAPQRAPRTGPATAASRRPAPQAR